MAPPIDRPRGVASEADPPAASAGVAEKELVVRLRFSIDVAILDSGFPTNQPPAGPPQ
jgi:hypothetical protein